jgi:predicted SprT family Zn-dependent metalloprotease
MATFTTTSRVAWAGQKALELMARHGLFGWEFAFNKNVRRAGVCFHPRSDRPGRIGLSVHYCERNSEVDILDVILHEIAHALVGPGHGHGEAWKAKCREIGARPQRCYDGDRIDMPRGAWRATCPSCQQVYDRHRRPKSLAGWHCRRCGRARGVLTWGMVDQTRK